MSQFDKIVTNKTISNVDSNIPQRSKLYSNFGNVCSLKQRQSTFEVSRGDKVNSGGVCDSEIVVKQSALL